ncbi:23S rRNA methyltransferase [Pasteurellaceae bacterium RH1A]|nr:23S rRNA methyltransferase [Pasteurellaceae bacterium RH1A]
MALFYSEKATKLAKKTQTRFPLQIQSLDYQGLGVAKREGKTWFVENALPEERVEVQVLEEKRQYGRAQAVKILQKSAHRQTASCAYYGRCGGCQMQHIPLDMQRQAKQDALFQRLQKLQADPIDFQSMLVGESKAYRRRAKLSIALQKNQLVVGFRQAASQQIIPLEHCEVLEKALEVLLQPLQTLLASWQNKKALGHIELVHADNGVALLLRHLGKLTDKDETALRAFAEAHALNLFVMLGEDQIDLWAGAQPFYSLGDLRLHFSIRDFIQINRELNQKMVQTALNWLELSPQDRVLDLFCGMGNFSLPLAQKAGFVVGVEGVAPMVEQAQANAAFNQLENVAFYQTNLDEPFHTQPWAREAFNKILLDPARNGAYFALDHLCQLQPERIVYVSCNPATLVRDAQKLIQAGYKLEKSAMIDMFPQTGHLESISLFLGRFLKVP